MINRSNRYLLPNPTAKKVNVIYQVNIKGSECSTTLSVSENGKKIFFIEGIEFYRAMDHLTKYLGQKLNGFSEPPF